MATYIIVPPACRGTHRQITGLPHYTPTPSYMAILRVCTCDAKLRFTATGLKTRRKVVTNASVLQVDVCVASLCSNPAKNPTSTGSLSEIREPNALKCPRSNHVATFRICTTICNNILLLRICRRHFLPLKHDDFCKEQVSKFYMLLYSI